MVIEDEIATAEADAEDIATGRIRSKSHLKIIDSFLSVFGELGDTADYVYMGKIDLYKFINSKSVKELNSLIKKVRKMTQELNKELGIGE